MRTLVQPGVPEQLRVELRALGFLERRRFDFAEAHLILDRLRLGGADGFERRLDRRVLQQPRAELRRVLLRRAERHDHATQSLLVNTASRRNAAAVSLNERSNWLNPKSRINSGLWRQVEGSNSVGERDEASIVG